jgi:hypothetical protein
MATTFSSYRQWLQNGCPRKCQDKRSLQIISLKLFNCLFTCSNIRLDYPCMWKTLLILWWNIIKNGHIAIGSDVSLTTLTHIHMNRFHTLSTLTLRMSAVTPWYCCTFLVSYWQFIMFARPEVVYLWQSAQNIYPERRASWLSGDNTNSFTRWSAFPHTSPFFPSLLWHSLVHIISLPLFFRTLFYLSELPLINPLYLFSISD